MLSGVKVGEKALEEVSSLVGDGVPVAKAIERVALEHKFTRSAVSNAYYRRGRRPRQHGHSALTIAQENAVKNVVLAMSLSNRPLSASGVGGLARTLGAKVSDRWGSRFVKRWSAELSQRKHKALAPKRNDESVSR